MTAEHFTRAEKIFDPETVKRLAEIGKFEATANLENFRDLLSLAAGLYLEELDAPDCNAIVREMKNLYDGKVGLSDVSETTQRIVRQRAERLKKEWPPSSGDIKSLAACGAEVVPDTKRSKTRRKMKMVPILFAPTPTRHPKRRLAATVFTTQIKAIFSIVNGGPPPETATIRPSTQIDDDLIGPFPKMLREIFRLCETPEVDVRHALQRAHDFTKIKKLTLTEEQKPCALNEDNNKPPSKITNIATERTETSAAPSDQPIHQIDNFCSEKSQLRQ